MVEILSLLYIFKVCLYKCKMSFKRSIRVREEIDEIDKENVEFTADDHFMKKAKVNKINAYERKKHALDDFSKSLETLKKYTKEGGRNFQPEKLEQIKHIKGFNGILRPYQVEGVLWLKNLYDHNLNGILADEMGLGKTVQLIAFFLHLSELGENGIHLIGVPFSTLPNWKSEFKRFAPIFNVYVLHGTSDNCKNVLKQFIADCKGNKQTNAILLSAHNNIRKYIKRIREIKWNYVAIDEAHIMKNHKSKITIDMKTLKCKHKLLITGTPLQNDITELWSLFNFLMPAIFKTIETFSSMFMLEDLEEENIRNDINKSIISKFQEVLKWFMLRRLKVDVLDDIVPKKEVLVYCPLAPRQKSIYINIIRRKIEVITGRSSESVEILPRTKRQCTLNVNYRRPTSYDRADYPSKKVKTIKEEQDKKLNAFLYNISVLNPVMAFRKCVAHPYLIEAPIDPLTKNIKIDENLVTESGKLLVLDAMLAKLKKQGHKVLLFSTLKISLDLIEDFCILRNFNYERLDGECKLETRQASIDNFNQNDKCFIFLITVRAGGVGLNLTGADTVIFYDKDWNPQVDIQAQDRCHRIGQTRPVAIYTLVIKNTLDECVQYRGEMKRRLERLIISDKKASKVDEQVDVFMELQRAIENNKPLTIHPNGYVFSDKELEVLLDRSDIEKQWEEKKKLFLQ